MAHHGIPPEIVPAIAALEYHPGDPIAERLATTGTVVINDIAAQQWLPVELLRRFQVAAVIGSPLIVRGRALGACFAFNTFHPRPFDPAQVQLFEGIARHVGLAIESADLYRAQQEEVRVAAALARVARELISSLHTAPLLDKLCRLTATTLGCDAAHAFLLERDDAGEAIVPACSFGDTPEQWETIRLLRIRPALVAELFAALTRGEVTEVTPEALRAEPAVAHLFEQQGVTRALMVALRVGETVRGFLGASRRGRAEAFTSEQERMLRGIARIASLALENARLVEELDASNRIRARFVATMSHELRSPIGITIGYADLLLEGAHGPLTREQAEVVRRIRHNAAESLDIIGATLDLSRAEARRVPLEIEAVVVPDLIDELAREIAVPGNRPDLTLVWQVAPGLAPLRTDRVKLRMVLKNLLHNAVKFTERGTVTLRVEPDGDGARFTVSDTGAGIPAEQLGTIFEPFTQAHGPASRRRGGAGLGLYIAQRLVEILGGTISVDSEVGRGSTFAVWIPRAVDPTALAAAGR
jgi:signal transduction histidine kinase